MIEYRDDELNFDDIFSFKHSSSDDILTCRSHGGSNWEVSYNDVTHLMSFLKNWTDTVRPKPYDNSAMIHNLKYEDETPEQYDSRILQDHYVAVKRHNDFDKYFKANPKLLDGKNDT